MSGGYQQGILKTDLLYTHNHNKRVIQILEFMNILFGTELNLMNGSIGSYDAVKYLI